MRLPRALRDQKLGHGTEKSNTCCISFMCPARMSRSLVFPDNDYTCGFSCENFSMNPIHPANLATGEDVRVDRTRSRLAAAVLELASEKTMVATTVLELTKRAGINRSTFYAHADSPMQLLTDVLCAELNALHLSAMNNIQTDGVLHRDITRHALNQIIDHVIHHEAIYAGPAHSSSRFALRVVLADHVERSVLAIFHQGFTSTPLGSEEAKTLYAGFLAHGIAGAVEAWLHLPAPRDRQLLLAAVEAMYPAWYAPIADWPSRANVMAEPAG